MSETVSEAETASETETVPQIRSPSFTLHEGQITKAVCYNAETVAEALRAARHQFVCEPLADPATNGERLEVDPLRRGRICGKPRLQT